MRIRYSLAMPFVLLALMSAAAARAEDCLSNGCHRSIDGLESRHDPVAGGECEACHQRQAGAHPKQGATAFKQAAVGKELCLQCHEPPGQGEIAHAPAEEGECLFCHNPHGGAEGMVRERETAAICKQCHDDSRFESRYLHGPVAAGECTFCHDPHRGPETALLRKPVRELCLGCHEDFEHVKEAPFSHPPVRDDACTKCHDPHGAPSKHLLASGQPGICIDCHPRIGEKMKMSAPHAPLEAPESCGGCHSTHYSEHDALLPEEQVDLCLSCHGPKGSGGRTQALHDIAAELKGKKYLHGPIEAGECAACHDPHGTGTLSLLSAPYPADFYAPFKPETYDFCLGCHEENLLRFPDTSIYTEFRNGKENLHYVHVADPRKGRTCRACHEPHASNLPKLIREQGASFGDWRIPIRFKMTETGGSCAPGCHRELAYDREKPVKADSTPLNDPK